MTLTETPPATARSWFAGLAAASSANLVAIGAAWLWTYEFDGLDGPAGLLLTALLLTAWVGVVMVLTSPWRRFGAGVLSGSALVFAAYFALLMWIGTQIGS